MSITLPPLPRPGPLGLIQYAGVDMQEYAAAVSAAKDAEIVQLRAELLKSLADNAALRKRVRELTTQAMFNTSTIERLRAEVAGLREDAERYRHMRNNSQFQSRNGPGLYWYLPRGLQGDEGEQLDAAIDAARKGEA